MTYARLFQDQTSGHSDAARSKALLFNIIFIAYKASRQKLRITLHDMELCDTRSGQCVIQGQVNVRYKVSLCAIQGQVNAESSVLCIRLYILTFFG